MGSIIAGPADFIHSAHRIRKVVGGGMRQAGILASVGLHSITQMTDRLKEDHGRAKTLWDVNLFIVRQRRISKKLLFEVI